MRYQGRGSVGVRETRVDGLMRAEGIEWARIGRCNYWELHCPCVRERNWEHKSDILLASLADFLGIYSPRKTCLFK